MLTWDEPKRKLNIKNHGLDFVGCDAIWDHFTVTREDSNSPMTIGAMPCLKARTARSSRF